MQCIQTGGVYKWWESKYGRPYPISGLELHSNFIDDHLQNWLKLLRQKTLDEVGEACASNLEGRVVPFDKDNFEQIRNEILQKIISVFQQTVKQALLEDPIANSYYEKWSLSKKNGFEKTALDMREERLIRDQITKYLKDELDKNRQTFFQVFWQRISYSFEHLDLIPLYKD